MPEEPGEIGREARRLEEKGLRRRMLPRRPTVRRVSYVAAAYLLLLAGAGWLWSSAGGGLELLPWIVLMAFVFETVDSAAGMGFGTALAPLLFALGYGPLEVVPVLLVSQGLAGFGAGAVHHQLKNARFSLTLETEASRAVLIITAAGVFGTIGSILVGYGLLGIPEGVVKGYVAVLVIAMGIFGLMREHLGNHLRYRPRLLAGFAVLAGVNKGIGGGGYGPVVTLGQIYSGVYEKSATAITTLAEGGVSLIGAAVYILYFDSGAISWVLLPSVLLGATAASFAGPYLVRVLPNRVLSYLIPVYAVGVGGYLLLQVAT